MTPEEHEEFYVIVRDLSTISAAKRVLNFITPESSDYISLPEFTNLMKKLTEWETIHFTALSEIQEPKKP